MSFKEKLKKELIAVGITFLYFACWFSGLILLKVLLLQEYEIEFSGISNALIGALIVAKVILILENVSLGSCLKKKPAILDVFLRTILFALGIVLILILEQGLEGRNEYGGFGPSVQHAFSSAEIHHVWVNTICIFGSLLGFNMASLVKKHLGEGGFLRILSSPTPN